MESPPYAESPSIFGPSSRFTYDGLDTVVFKANYILTKGLGRVYVTDVNQDDFWLSATFAQMNLIVIAKTIDIKASNLLDRRSLKQVPLKHC